MKSIGLILGVFGLLFMVVSPTLGLLGLVIGALMFISGANSEKRELEERRYQELLQATREQSKKP